MSVNLLENTTQPVNIYDELESFLHVLVYYSVRYLRSNCPSPDSWIDNYFVVCGSHNVYTGGFKSLAVKNDGFLNTHVPEGPLLFDSPMDRLLATLLKSFRAHYEIRHFEIHQALSPSPSPSSSGKGSPVDARAALAARNFIPKMRPEDDPELAAYIAELKSAVRADNAPTEEDRRLASRVADHSFILEYIAKLLRRKDWPDDDRLPEHSASPAPVSEIQSESESDRESRSDTEREVPEPAPKRRRKVAPKEKADETAPNQMDTAVRRTRSQTRAAAAVRKAPARRRRT